MKITDKERKEIIKEAIAQVKGGTHFLCCIFATILMDRYNIKYHNKPKDIQKYIPNFKNSTAVKYFSAKRGFCWWEMEEKDQRNRLRFLRYLLTGKLPKKVSKKK